MMIVPNKNEKIPLRTCIVCKEKMPKKQLGRIVINSDGNLEYDRTGKKNGRGAYICMNSQCLSKLNASILSRTFKQQITSEKTEDLKNILYKEMKTM
jgi:predicted RNA-binding protein YlxR (DUF448 family)